MDLVKILLRYKADPNFVNQAGFNMLMMAANRGHVEVVSRVILYCKDNPRSGSGLLGMKDRYVLSRARVARMRQTWLSSPDQGGKGI